MKTYFNTVFMAFFLSVVLNGKVAGKIIIVDKSGLGQHTTIQAGINAAVSGDTVKVFPGVYNEKVTVGKGIVLQGSGYEYTRIVADVSPALSLSAGKVMWFAISSNVGNAVDMTGGTLTNCVIWNSPGHGIYYNGSTIAKVQNCVLVNTGQRKGTKIAQIYAEPYGLSVVNTILWTFSSGDFNDAIASGCCEDKVGILYCRTWDGEGTGGTNKNPQFLSSTDFRITNTSPCWDTGKPDIYDPDGSRSDMGYYGGPDAPVAPVVTDLRIYVNPDGTVNVQAKAQSTY